MMSSRRVRKSHVVELFVFLSSFLLSLAVVSAIWQMCPEDSWESRVDVEDYHGYGGNIPRPKWVHFETVELSEPYEQKEGWWHTFNTGTDGPAGVVFREVMYMYPETLPYTGTFQTQPFSFQYRTGRGVSQWAQIVEGEGGCSGPVIKPGPYSHRALFLPETGSARWEQRYCRADRASCLPYSHNRFLVSGRHIHVDNYRFTDSRSSCVSSQTGLRFVSAPQTRIMKLRRVVSSDDGDSSVFVRTRADDGCLGNEDGPVVQEEYIIQLIAGSESDFRIRYLPFPAVNLHFVRKDTNGKLCPGPNVESVSIFQFRSTANGSLPANVVEMRSGFRGSINVATVDGIEFVRVGDDNRLGVCNHAFRDEFEVTFVPPNPPMVRLQLVGGWLDNPDDYCGKYFRTTHLLFAQPVSAISPPRSPDVFLIEGVSEYEFKLRYLHGGEVVGRDPWVMREYVGVRIDGVLHAVSESRAATFRFSNYVSFLRVDDIASADGEPYSLYVWTPTSSPDMPYDIRYDFNEKFVIVDERTHSDCGMYHNKYLFRAASDGGVGVNRRAVFRLELLY